MLSTRLTSAGIDTSILTTLTIRYLASFSGFGVAMKSKNMNTYLFSQQEHLISMPVVNNLGG